MPVTTPEKSDPVSKQDTEQASVADQLNAEKETRAHVTAFAFGVNHALLGKPLAKPARRAWALAIDGIVVAILSALPGFMLMLMLAGACVVAINRSRKKERLRRWLPFYRAALVVCVLAAMSMWLEPVFNNNVRERLKNIPESNQCDDAECFEQAFASLPTTLRGLGIDEKSSEELIEFVVENSAESLNEEEQQHLRQAFSQQFLSEAVIANDPSPGESGNTANALGNAAAIYALGYDNGSKHSERQAKENSISNSLIDWIQGILTRDLGLSFGWAAFYFTVMIAWFEGQTLGKLFLGIRVVKLDNKPISLWEAFGRYGGYSAGLATGLLGFLQVYWDPNRQAIHDKISSTVVVRI